MWVPELLTPRLRLRPLRLADSGDLYELLREPAATRFLPFEPTPELVWEHVLESVAARYTPGMGSFVWEERETGRFVGHGDLRPSQETEDERIETGWYLMRRYRGRGLAVEATRAILRHAFRTMDLPEVIALVHEENEASRRVARRLGFRIEQCGTYYGGPHLLYTVDSRSGQQDPEAVQ
ncbi:N-acetyltransferase [Longimycelium tulufanense]|uniref:N-acetyltransferase n=1 Tax=Longimycelium tulufanense TaxID=907463 RepID=A0A8J3C8A0_9PSEU|nr:GNAT family N-acetyltransferase [Longimycelium tulufanense]GGM54739.1 N-acetyltransferase [Longimycelium tulufanense]